jgi:hypothetical protein
MALKVAGKPLSNDDLAVGAVVLAFLFFFATLMAFFGRRETPRPPSPR